MIWVSDVIGGNRKIQTPPAILIRENMRSGICRFGKDISANTKTTRRQYGGIGMYTYINPSNGYRIGKDGGLEYHRT